MFKISHRCWLGTFPVIESFLHCRQGALVDQITVPQKLKHQAKGCAVHARVFRPSSLQVPRGDGGTQSAEKGGGDVSITHI